MLSNIKLIVAYDGTRYLGWQKTKMGSSIEETLQGVLERILQHKITLQAASRTDAGVHAEGQVVNFFTNRPINISKLLIGINSLLPKDIVVLGISEEKPDFHPTLHAIKKEYHYTLSIDRMQMPHDRLTAWHFPYALNIELMRSAALFLNGRHDFAAFCNVKKNSHYSHKVREISEIYFDELPFSRLRIHIQGSNFLYKMVRNIVGTLVYVGCGKISLESIPNILLGCDRTKAGVTAPSHGLTLHKIFY